MKDPTPSKPYKGSFKLEVGISAFHSRNEYMECIQITFILSNQYSGTLFIMGDMFQDSQWMPKSVDSTKPYIY